MAVDLGVLQERAFVYAGLERLRIEEVVVDTVLLVAARSPRGRRDRTLEPRVALQQQAGKARLAGTARAAHDEQERTVQGGGARHGGRYSTFCTCSRRRSTSVLSAST